MNAKTIVPAAPVRQISCGHAARIGCQPAPQYRERLLWQMRTFERPSDSGGCTWRIQLVDATH